MRFFHFLPRIPSLLTSTLLLAAYGSSPVHLDAATSVTAQQFTSPEEAIKSLQTAVAAKDQSALQVIFGPEFKALKTGDSVQDADNALHFAAALAQGCHRVNRDDDTITLEVGTNDWPMPIPLVKSDGQWHFDTAAGREEIINRHIGKDELCAIGVCRAYVTAQRQYASASPATTGTINYALKFKSTPGKKDGLYWPAAANEPSSPFGPLVAEAHAAGYVSHRDAGPHPFHGYYFRILTRQGEAAPGGKLDYMSKGKLAGGFALVAYPEHWDQSGIMTFMVNQDGQVYQRDCGIKSSQIGAALTEYSPDTRWSLVPDAGLVDAVSEN